jgi:hypothetical protein
MQNLSLSENQKKHIKNLFKQLSAVKIEMKSKMILLTASFIKKHQNKKMNVTSIFMNNQSDEQVLFSIVNKLSDQQSFSSFSVNKKLHEQTLTSILIKNQSDLQFHFLSQYIILILA